MPDFSTILQAPEVRALVQEGTLERAFHDALFPRLLYRGEAEPRIWPGQVGDQLVFTGAGLIKKNMRPLPPGTDPTPKTYTSEQWVAQAQQYADSQDTHMPTSIAAIVNLFYRNAQQLGLQAGQSLNGLVRNKMYNSAMAGHTVADGTQPAGNTVRVKRLNGFTRARRPDLAGASPVKFELVSPTNPLPARLFTTGSGIENARNIVGFTPDNPGDELGPGVLTFDGAALTFTDRDYLLASSRTFMVRVGGGNSVDAVGAADTLKLQDIRSAVSRFWSTNVPEFGDGYFHCHMDPTSQAQVYNDPEFQRLMTSLPDMFPYKNFALGHLLNTVFFRNSEAPLPETVEGSAVGNPFTLDDPFGGELYNATSVRIHRPLFVGQGLIMEYYMDLASLMTEAGVTGRVGEPRITNNGIEVFSERIQLIIRSPLNRLQDMVSTSWKFIGDWPVRTDSATGDGAAFKRALIIEHGE